MIEAFKPTAVVVGVFFMAVASIGVLRKAATLGLAFLLLAAALAVGEASRVTEHQASQVPVILVGRRLVAAFQRAFGDGRPAPRCIDRGRDRGCGE